jgi:DNA replication and repair protein RecF
MLVLLKYNKVLKQRNAYLKQLYTSGMSSKEYLDVLTKKIIEYGKSIYNYRREFIENINKYISDIYINIFGEGIIKVNYKSEFQAEEKKLLDYYRKNYSREMAFGKTLYGIHHDDFEFILDENRLKEIGSQGQMKNAIISFKLSEINLIKDIKDDYPILILDDLFSELDNEKINNILNFINKDIQSFITTTDIDKINKNIVDNSKLLLIKDRIIREVKK